jgi:hypothetical protein
MQQTYYTLGEIVLPLACAVGIMMLATAIRVFVVEPIERYLLKERKGK